MENALALRNKFFQQGTGGLGDDNRQSVPLGFLFQQLFQPLNIERIDFIDVFNAHCLA